jgi:hypothetical protein
MFWVKNTKGIGFYLTMIEKKDKKKQELLKNTGEKTVKKKCKNCGSSFEGRTTRKYCSDSCKAKASQNRKKHTQLSDSVSLVPASYQVANIPTTASIVESFANQSVAGVMQQVTVPHIGQVVSTLQDPKVPKSNKAWLVAGGVLGGTVGYQLAGKGKRGICEVQCC